MSGVKLADGMGSGILAKVDSRNRLHVHGVQESVGQNSAKEGLAFNVNTGTIKLTTANKSALLYIKNEGEYDLHISSIGFLIGNSIGGAGDLLCQVEKNIGAGTIISTATAPAINTNKNCGSNLVLDAAVFAGAEAATCSGGEDFYLSLLPGSARVYVINTGDIVIPRGTSICVSMTPQTGNTDMDVQVFLALNVYNLT